MRVVVLLVSTALLLIVPSRVGAIGNGRTIIVRWYNVYGVSLGQLTAAQRTARDIFRRAGFEPSWRTCRTRRGPSGSSSDLCTDTVPPTELIVRLVAMPVNIQAVNEGRLGFSYVDVGAHAGVLSTVFPDRIGALANLAGVDPGVLLGRAAAHEIGHLLMGNTLHSATGLMRTEWSLKSLRRDPKSAWAFATTDVAQMQAGLLGRAGSTSASLPIAAHVFPPMLTGALVPVPALW